MEKAQEIKKISEIDFLNNKEDAALLVYDLDLETHKIIEEESFKIKNYQVKTLTQTSKEVLPVVIGPEVELIVLDSSFKEINEAKKVLELSQKNNFSFVHECSLCNVEFVGSPGTIKEIVLQTTYNLESLDEETKKQGIRLVPVDFPLDHSFKAEITNHPRYTNKEKIIGEERFNICKRILGTHFHFDLDIDPKIKISQINFLALFDPLAITATATHRHTLNGQIINNWRVYAYRYLAHKEFPYQGDIQKLYESYEEYIYTLKEEYNKFLGVALSRQVDFSSTSTMEDAVWGPVRINSKYKTVEMRSISSHPDLVTVFSVVALASGGMRKILKRETKIEELYLLLTGTTNMDEASAYLKKIDYEATLHGFKSNEVKEYCKKLLFFCSQKLDEQETKLVKKGLEKFWGKTSKVESVVLSNKKYEQKYEELYEIYVDSLKELKKIWG